MRSVDVVVIGAGAMGSATAWWLAREGRDVVLIEQFEQGHARGSSHGGTRIFRMSYSDPFYVAMARSAHALWRELEADTGQTLLEATGHVDHGDTASVRALADAMAAAREPYELVPSEEAAERWPGMRFDDAVLCHADGGRCLADRAVRALQVRVAALGGDLRFAVGPASLATRRDGVVVRAADERWDARAAVVTAGPWIGKVLATVGLTDRLPPLRPVQVQVQHFSPDEPHGADAWPSFIHHREPWHYGLYSSNEGVKVACGADNLDIDPDTRPPRDPRQERAVVRYVEEWFPGLDPTPRHRALCLCTLTPTDDFVVDRVGPIVVGSACSGHGFKFTPLVGRWLAELALGQPGPDRFRLSH